MKKKIAVVVVAILVIAGACFFIFKKPKESQQPHVKDSFTAKMELKVYGVDIDGTVTRENKEKITVQVTSPEDLKDFSVVFDKSNQEKPVRLQFKNLEYNVGEHASPVSEGVTIVASLLEQLSKQPGQNEYTIHDDKFGEIKLEQKQGDIIISNKDSLKIRLFDFQ